MNYSIQAERTCLVQKTDIYGNVKLISKSMPVYVGVVSPFGDIPLIMYTRLASETILHTEADILMVTEILHKKGIKHKIKKVEKDNNNFRSICKI